MFPPSLLSAVEIWRQARTVQRVATVSPSRGCESLTPSSVMNESVNRKCNMSSRMTNVGKLEMSLNDCLICLLTGDVWLTHKSLCYYSNEILMLTTTTQGKCAFNRPFWIFEIQNLCLLRVEKKWININNKECKSSTLALLLQPSIYLFFFLSAKQGDSARCSVVQRLGLNTWRCTWSNAQRSAHLWSEPYLCTGNISPDRNHEGKTAKLQDYQREKADHCQPCEVSPH